MSLAPVKTNLSVMLAAYRERKQISLDDLAVLTDITKPTLYRIEQGYETNQKTFLRLINWMLLHEANSFAPDLDKIKEETFSCSLCGFQDLILNADRVPEIHPDCVRCANCLKLIILYPEPNWQKPELPESQNSRSGLRIIPGATGISTFPENQITKEK